MTTTSTLGQSNLIRTQIANLQTQINTLQQQATSGLKASVYGGLGTQASLDIDLRNQGAHIDTFQTNITFLQTRSQVVDQNLNAIVATGQHLFDLTVSSGTTDQGRQQIINEANSVVTEVTQQLQVNVDGRFLFGGVNTGAQPMVNDQTLLANVKTAINTALTAAPPPANVPAAISAAVDSVFATPTNFYVGGPNVAPTEVDDGLKLNLGITGDNQAFIDTLKGAYTIAALSMPVNAPATLPQLDRATFDQVVQTAAGNMFGGISEVQDLISQNGSNQTELKNISQQHEQTQTLLQSQVDNIETVNLADVSTRLTALTTQLQASYSLTGQLKNLSLVNFLPAGA
jgi:flagellar hook-associated protein 3 FlgL